LWIARGNNQRNKYKNKMLIFHRSLSIHADNKIFSSGENSTVIKIERQEIMVFLIR